MTSSVLTTERLQEHAPAIFASDRYDGTSEKFQFINTADLVQVLRGEGFIPVRAKQTQARIPERRGFSRHMVVFRLPDQPLARRGDVAPEIVLFNAHDGTSSYRLHAGVFRLVCENGLVVSHGSVAALRIPHSRRHSLEQVVTGTHDLVQALPDVLSQIDTWKATPLSESQRLSFAHDALALRYGDAPPITPAQVVQPRRSSDRSPDLFTTFNVVQEHLLRGGLAGQRADGKRVTTRRLTAIDATTRLNLALWDLTASYSYSLN
jgi:hypothetical protein